MLLRSIRLGTLFVLAIAVAAPAVASARSVSYTGEATKLRAGQTRGLPVYVGFVLVGKGCPTKPSCLEHAKVRAVSSVAWAYPNCPEVLDGIFELDAKSPVPVGPRPPHAFVSAGISELYSQTHVSFHGRFRANGKARGWFEVEEGPCSTGRIPWAAEPD